MCITGKNAIAIPYWFCIDDLYFDYTVYGKHKYKAFYKLRRVKLMLIRTRYTHFICIF